MLGKEKCKVLRSVRRIIAKANQIPFESPDCTHAGSCPGTCPLCESELKYLEEQLQKRRAEGKPVKLAGLCVGMDRRPSPEQHPSPVREYKRDESASLPPDLGRELAGVPVRPDRDFSQYPSDQPDSPWNPDEEILGDVRGTYDFPSDQPDSPWDPDEEILGDVRGPYDYPPDQYY